MTQILLGLGASPVHLLARYGNRHGLIAGATGTGKSVSLMLLAEGFSRLGVPVFLGDVKGDLAGLAAPGALSDPVKDRVQRIGIDGYTNEANPVIFWDLYGKAGHPVRTTVSELGPQLIGRMLELNDTQIGVLEVIFQVADEEGLLLLDLDDLRSLLTYVADNRKEISAQYGLVSPQTISLVQRALLTLEREGGEALFGEPALDLTDIMRTDLGGRGIISILAADQLVLKPRLYSSFLLYLLSELFENLPEIGDMEKPKMVFFFDEAHLLFDDAPPALRQRVEQVVRLIRSKGVGVYFISQFPDDVPTEILGQLGNRVQHALRAYTPRDQKAVRTAAETFPSNPSVDVATVISTLGTGEALVSTLQDRGIPMPVEQTVMAPPRCRIGALSPEERAAVRARSPVGGKYDTAVNRESAYEMLTKRAAAAAPVGGAEPGVANPPMAGEQATEAPSRARPSRAAEAAGAAGAAGALGGLLFGTGRRQGMVETMAKQAARTVGSQVGRQIMRGLLGGLLGGSRRR